VGFPSNDFGQQEPGSDKEIADFCRLTYDVKFPMFSKTSVAGARANPFYRDLAQRTSKTPQWNFHKYLIDRSGQQVLSFDSRVAPDDPALQHRRIHRRGPLSGARSLPSHPESSLSPGEP